MGRHQEGLTREYVIRFLVENKGALSTHRQIVNSVNNAFKTLFKESITPRSIDKALTELTRSGIVIKASDAFTTAGFSTRSFEYELDSYRVSELTESEEIRLFKETVELRKGTLDKDNERKLKIHLMVRRGLEIERDINLLNYEVRSTIPSSWAVQAFEDENETAKILKAFSVWKVLNKKPYLKYNKSS